MRSVPIGSLDQALKEPASFQGVATTSEAIAGFRCGSDIITILGVPPAAPLAAFGGSANEQFHCSLADGAECRAVISLRRVICRS